MINYHILVTGRVQGVGFRWATVQLAQNLGIYGYVCNLTNGKVFIVAQGNKTQLTIFLNKIQAGPNSWCQVRNVQVKQAQLEKLSDFTIKNN